MYKVCGRSRHENFSKSMFDCHTVFREDGSWVGKYENTYAAHDFPTIIFSFFDFEIHGGVDLLFFVVESCILELQMFADKLRYVKYGEGDRFAYRFQEQKLEHFFHLG